MSKLAVDIRPAVQADAAAVARVHVETWRSAYAGLIPDDYLVGMSERRQRGAWHRLLAQRNAREGVLVAEAPGPERNQVVGFGSCGRGRDPGLPFDGEIYTLYVALDWQGKGLGRRLLHGLFGSLARAGCASAGLWVLSGNPARYFYEAVGGEACALRQERFAGALLDETAYRWTDLSIR